MDEQHIHIILRISRPHLRLQYLQTTAKDNTLSDQPQQLELANFPIPSRDLCYLGNQYFISSNNQGRSLLLQMSFVCRHDAVFWTTNKTFVCGFLFLLKKSNTDIYSS
jgi:hypothetical protein